jgi:group I intron endonuclease
VSDLLKNKGGIYCFINTIDNKQYIGSAKDLYLRLLEHLACKKSNVALQRAIEKYGLSADWANLIFASMSMTVKLSVVKL